MQVLLRLCPNALGIMGKPLLSFWLLYSDDRQDSSAVDHCDVSQSSKFIRQDDQLGFNSRSVPMEVTSMELWTSRGTWKSIHTEGINMHAEVLTH